MQAYGIAPARSVAEMISCHGAHGATDPAAEKASVDMLRYLWNLIIAMAADSA